MYRKILKWVLIAAALFIGAPTYGQDVHIMWKCGATGFAAFCQVEAANPLPVTGTFTPAGTQNVNITQILGAAPSLTNPLWVFPATGATFPVSGTLAVTQSTSPWVVAGSGTAGTANAGVVTVQGIASMTPLSVTGTFFQTTQPISIASAQVVSGAYASGSLASGSMVDLVALSAPVAPATATATKSVLLGAQATTAAVNPTTGQQSALSSDTNNNLLVSTGGAPNITTSQVTVTTSSTAVCPVRALRRSCSVSTITGTQQMFCSGTTATAGNGQIFPAVVGASFPFLTTAAVNCIAISSSQTVSIVELF